MSEGREGTKADRSCSSMRYLVFLCIEPPPSICLMSSSDATSSAASAACCWGSRGEGDFDFDLEEPKAIMTSAKGAKEGARKDQKRSPFLGLPLCCTTFIRLRRP